ncbi:MAG TPA: hypothetical protein VH391_10925 [Solirubrobacterales bacterium]
MKRSLRRSLLRVVGRNVTCELCGEPLFRTSPFVRRGRVKLPGADEALVHVDFDSANVVVFRHVEADRCPALRGER